MASRILLFFKNLYMGEQIGATDLTHSQSSVSGMCKSASIWSVYISRAPHGNSGALISFELAGTGVKILLLLRLSM